MQQSASPEAAATLLRMYYEMDVRDVLPAIHVPTLVLSRGGELAEESAATAGRIPGAIHSVMPGHDRMVMGGHADSYCDRSRNSSDACGMRRPTSIAYSPRCYSPTSSGRPNMRLLSATAHGRSSWSGTTASFVE